MPAYLYQRKMSGGKSHFSQIKYIQLAGRGAIWSAWLNQGKPIDKGWHIPSSELILYALGGMGDVKDREVIIDAAPSLKTTVDLVQLLDIYVFTHGDKSGTALWSPLLIRVKQVYFEQNLSPAQKGILTENFEEMSSSGEDILAFLYLHGEERRWNWGRLGQMNGAWLLEKPREFFRQFF